MKYSALILTSILSILACQKHHDNPVPVSDLNKPYALPATAQANPAYDVSGRGIYKGVTIPEIPQVKTLFIDVANTGNTAYSLQYENGLLKDSLIRYVVDSVFPTVRYPLQIDDSVIDPNKGIFTYFRTYKTDSLRFPGYFSVNADGSSPNFRSDFSGTTALLKERSTNQVFCFTGTYQGHHLPPNNTIDSGQVGFVLNADTVIALQINTVDDPYTGPAGGTVSNNQINIIFTDFAGAETFMLTGTITGNTLSGTWKSSLSAVSGTFTAQRTL